MIDRLRMCAKGTGDETATASCLHSVVFCQSNNQTIKQSNNLKSGFTIIELLVASLLLGMLVTILTMIFNQSSIAWRTGVAGVADLDDIRDNVAELREEADNAFIATVGGSYQVFRHVGLWDSRGRLRDRSCDAPNSEVMSEGSGKLRANIIRQSLSVSESTKPSDIQLFNVGNAGNPRSVKNYTVNVMSAGPDKTFDTWDDIWSWPDDFE